MSTILNTLLQDANEVAELGLDMSEVSTGGTLLPAGTALARLVYYVEFGKHATEFEGVKKAPTMQIRLGFALWGSQYQKADGTPGFIRSWDLSLGNNEKAKVKLAFDRMNYKGTAKHFAQLLGQAILLPITLTKDSKGKERNGINWAGIAPPINPVDGSTYPVPEATDDLYTVLLWDKPNKTMWDKLFREGKTDKGESKNYDQEKCLKATDFRGSALETLLGGGIPDVTAQPLVAAVPEVLAPITAPVIAAPIAVVAPIAITAPIAPVIL